MHQPRPFLLFIFGHFKQTPFQFLQQILNVKNVHPVYGARIQTHDPWNMSLLPKPKDQGSRPKNAISCDIDFLSIIMLLHILSKT